ncbi:2525_t:CDS:2 [Entrophospora sp. SA101]|nr:2525_t:CDS:2 [Entrophospora sp. SA101]
MSEPDCTNMLKQSEEQLNHHVVVESHLYNNNTGQSSHSQHDEDSFQPQTPITPHSPFTPSLHSPSDLDQLITSKLPQKEETEQNVVSKGNDTNTAIVLRVPPPPLPPPPPINTNFPRDKLHLPLSHPPLLINRRENTFHHHRNHNDNRRKSSYDRRPDNIRFPREHCPSKLSPIIYEAPPMPPMPPNGPNPPPQSVYDYSQYPPDQQYYHGYYSSYPPELSNSNSNIPYADWQSQNSPVQSMPIHLASFQWNHPGRHTAIPLPTDFMSGPSSAPRLSMPEPHETLGYIKGVIIRDAQGNIGLSQYTFNTL